MKRILGLLMLLHTAIVSAQKAPEVKVAPLPDGRLLAAIAVVSHYTSVRSEPVPPVIYFNFEGLDGKELLRLVGSRPIKSTLKAGDNYELRGKRLVDKDTGKNCEFFHLSFTEFTGRQATVRVWWEASDTEWHISMLVLKLVKDKWEITDDKIELIP